MHIPPWFRLVHQVWDTVRTLELGGTLCPPVRYPKIATNLASGPSQAAEGGPTCDSPIWATRNVTRRISPGFSTYELGELGDLLVRFLQGWNLSWA